VEESMRAAMIEDYGAPIEPSGFKWQKVQEDQDNL
jgi:hypothetical protein